MGSELWVLSGWPGVVQNFWVCIISSIGVVQNFWACIIPGNFHKNLPFLCFHDSEDASALQGAVAVWSCNF